MESANIKYCQLIKNIRGSKKLMHFFIKNAIELWRKFSRLAEKSIFFAYTTNTAGLKLF